jgi:hypothetical protein
MTNSNFREFLNEKRAFYKKFNPVFCPILQETIYFTSKGFHHLRYDSFGRARKIKEQKYKLGLLPLVIPVIKYARKIEDFKQEREKKLCKNEQQWAIRGIVGKQNTDVKVILRKIGTGRTTFLSVMKIERKKKYYQKDRLF